MMSISVSIVIPVYNQWELTKNCLSSLAVSLPDQGVEIIVVDNASSDATEESCAVLGEQLFGQRFHYHRMEHNRNFGPASNFGAQVSRGEYVLFLNNDTLALPDCPHWLDALLQDFADYPGIAATGPVLLYPAKGPLGATVQHLGVFVSPTLKVGHLYEGIPASSSLTAKRRFFQIITAACMLMPRALFLRYGGFDERYINGFEDVDLCTRLWAAGYRMTVNPEARLYHLTSQTPGRHAHDVENSILFSNGNIQHLVPDWHAHLAKDDLELQVTEWQSLSPGMPPVQTARLAPLLKSGNATALCDALSKYPFWFDGYVRLAALLEKQGDLAGAHTILLSLAQLRPIPDYLFLLIASSRHRDEQASHFAVDNIFQYCNSFEKYLRCAEMLQGWAHDLGLEALSGQLQGWLNTSGEFHSRTFLPFLGKMRQMTEGIPYSPLMEWAYTLWRELVDAPQRAGRRSLLPESAQGPAFSVLMPIYNPKPEHVRAAVDSLLRQEWPHWELCMVDDASPDPEVRPLLHELVALDPRIRVEFREVNGHIAAATNTALDMARYEYIALMDQDDLLTPDALREVALAILSHPSGQLFYTDEDKVLEDGTICAPYFKNSAWDWELLMGQNMVNHLGVYRTERLRSIGGFRSEFPGAQDYDMLLRYTEGLSAAQLVHIPRVVYHWRAHAGSTAADIGAKSEVLDSALGALTEHLRRQGVEGTAELVPDTQFTRIRYALPQPLPLVSLIVDVGGDCPLAPALAQALLKKAGYAKLEIIVLYDQETEQRHRAQVERWAASQRHVRLLPLLRTLSFSERANAAGATARGSVLGFLGKGLVPLSQNWLAEFVAHLMQPGIGVIGGKLLGKDGTVYHVGHVPDAEGRLCSLFRGIQADDPGYCAWARLARTVSSVDPRCLFTHKRYFEEFEGFHPSMGGSGAIDFCLRLGEKGVRTVATPFTEFLFVAPATPVQSVAGDPDWESGIFVNDSLLHKKWHGRIIPCNPNLGMAGGEWVLSWANVAGYSLPNKVPCVPAQHQRTFPVRILFITPDGSVTGAPYSLLRLMRWLRASMDYEMGLLSLLDGPLCSDFERICPVEVVRDSSAFHMFGSRPTFVEVEQKLSRLLERMGGRPHCVFGNTSVAPLAYPCCKDFQVPFITRVAEMPTAIHRHIQPQIIREMLVYSDFYVAVSPPVAAMLQSKNVAEDAITIIPGGIADGQTSLDTARRKELLHNYGFDLDVPVLWGCGTLGATKGADLFYKTCIHLYDSGLRHFLAIWAGTPDGSLGDWLERPRDAHPAHGQIVFPGRMEYPYLLMRPGDIFLLTSREDSFPLTALEAGERGLPVIAFANSGGVVDFINKGAGLLAEYENSRQMAELTAGLLRSPKDLLAMGEKARRVVLENYTLDQLGPMYVQLFETVLQRRA